MKPKETLIVRPADRCEVHDWPTDGLAKRLILAIRRSGRGGVDICLDCGRRARESLGRRASGKESA